MSVYEIVDIVFSIAQIVIMIIALRENNRP